MARLNPAQQAAVEHKNGPLLVLAGAGSGKTRVITERIAYLINSGTRPDAIMAVSFTNKAATEMGERVAGLVGRKTASKLWLSTFHSFGVRFLSEESKALGYPSKFVVFDQGDAIGLLREVLRREGLADRKLDLFAVHSRISLWKNKRLPPEAVPASDFEYDVVARAAYPLYEAALANMCAVDFDDLVLKPTVILDSREDIRQKWRNRFRHLLVDEFQDTNRTQLDLVLLLTNELANVCVVGDDDQSIYAWRGADVGNILDFEGNFEQTKVVKLETNYRSRAPILEVANAAIARSKRKRHDKFLRAVRGEGAKVRVCTLDDPSAEASFVAAEARRLWKKGVELDEMAVLYRSNLQARLIEEELRVQGVPYKLYGGTQFFDRKEVKDAVAYLRVLVHRQDELSLRRILNYPTRGVGDSSIQRLTRWALAHGKTFSEAIDSIDEIDLPPAAHRGIRTLRSHIECCREAIREGAATHQVARRLFDAVGLRSALEDGTPSGQKRWANVEYVLNSLMRYEARAHDERPTLAQFLTRLTLQQDEKVDSQTRVTLSSLHAAKGLEFSVVFLIGLNEGQLPHQRTLDPKVTEAAPSDVEEERRLFYVGVTRARDQLYLCRPRRRMMRGQVSPLTPSRFLEGLPEDCLEEYERKENEVMAAEETAELGRAFLERLRSESGAS